MRILHVVGGSSINGAFQGAKILHNSLIDLEIESKILNDAYYEKKNFGDKNVIFFPNNFISKTLNRIFIFFEKILKSFYLHSPRETFTIGLLGFDLTKVDGYEEADLIHIHWLNQGFISLKSLSKIKKPVVWTMRDMWAFTGGSHYTMDFENYEKTRVSNYLKQLKKKYFKKNFQFVAVSEWLRKRAKNSSVLNEFNIIKIDNNIDVNKFRLISKVDAKNMINISTQKQIILYGAQNPQSKRKGWDIFVETLKKINFSNYYLLIFGKFWSENTLKQIGIEYTSLGYIKDTNYLNAVYCSADFFVASSIEDAWPKTFAEAMCCGTPVVCFSNTSISEIIDHKINGFIANGFDSKLLKEGIDWLSEEVKNDKIDREVVRAKVLKFSGDLIAKKYLALYRNLLQKNFF